MASKALVASSFLKSRNFSSVKRAFTGGKVIFNKEAHEALSSPSIPDVQGLSEACVKVPGEPVGPGASKNSDYKNPEYFCYDKNSYFEAEIEMLQYRCPQPSTNIPYYPNKN